MRNKIIRWSIIAVFFLVIFIAAGVQMGFLVTTGVFATFIISILLVYAASLTF
jgi:hypothetical protein